MTFDFNLIVEDYGFYQQLPPKMQSQVIEHVFDSFIE